MLTNLLSGYTPTTRIAIALCGALVLAFVLAEAISRLARLGLVRLASQADADGVRASLRPVVRVLRLVSVIGLTDLLAVPALEIAGLHTTIALHPENVLAWFVESGLRILLIATLAWFIVRTAEVVVTRLEHQASAGTGPEAVENAKRVRTLGNLVEYVVGVFVTGAAGLMVLRELHLDITPVLAGAGVVGLAVGFGAQSIVKDFFSGFFLILEDQVRVGDVAVVNGVGGLVESITLRKITLRDLEGTVHIFPNGSITTLANRTKDFSYALVDVGVGYGEDIDRVAAVLKDIGEQVRRDEVLGAAILDALEVMGVDQLAASSVVIRIRIKTLPQRQWEVARELRRRIKKRFDAEGIEIPFPKLSLAEPRKAVALAPRGADVSGADGPVTDGPTPVVQ
jgi:small conductance mechanosensitive channel